MPIAAKALSLVESPLELLFFGDFIKIELSLPFSWSAFFFSAVLFSVALLLFNICSPKIILENSTFTSYVSDGKSLAQLNRYAREIGVKEINISLEQISCKASQEKMDSRAQEMFWEIYESAENYREIWKCIIGILYVLGFLVMALVFSQNILYVSEVAFGI